MTTPTKRTVKRAVSAITGLAAAAIALTTLPAAYAHAIHEDTGTSATTDTLTTPKPTPETEAKYGKADSKLTDLLKDAKAKLDSTNGRVDDNTVRDTLSKAIDKATLTQSNLNETHGAFAAVAALKYTTLEDSASELTKLMGKVDEAVTARDARIKAEQEAATAAATQTQAQANAGSQSYTQYGNRGGSSSTRSYTPTRSYSGRNAGGYYSSASCSLQPGVSGGGCQGAIDRGGLTHMTTSTGTNIYAQHNNTGGAWINNLQTGQTISLNGHQYVVNGQSQQGAKYAPASGTWLQTCNGNGNHLVGITQIN